MFEPTTGLVIHSAHDLFDAADFRPAYLDSVDSLTIELQNELPVPIVRRILSLTANLTDLVLLLPPGAQENILSGLRFHGLDLFKTNLPHRLLVPFLANHTSLRIICLGSCGRGQLESCPLKACDLARIFVVESPCSCIPDLGHPQLTRLTLEGQGDPCFNSPAALKSLSNPLSSLLSLVIDFHPNDYDILDSIIRVAPNLLTLKLLEKAPAVTRRGRHHGEIQSRRAWNDNSRWFSSLLRLGRLEELALRTASRVIHSASNDPESEQATLMCWVTRQIRVSRSSQTSCHHPAMTSLRVWYKVDDRATGIITVWSKSSSGWCNISRTVDPPRHAVF
ncbi:hypothetical protein LXA43DRAFT_1068641 [Ganoderma leucocontextum]|nr:hypothetical protein LXA43DRAFT_1068641 [Ganoderma leucocontextum]